MISIAHIEETAKKLRKRIWGMRWDLWPGQKHDSRWVLDPELAAIAMGLQYEYRDDLGTIGVGRHEQRVAGCFLRNEGRILVSEKNGYVAQRFTGAHEIGHALLHSQRSDMYFHRDRPIFGLGGSEQGRSPIEREADRFAAAFLVPPQYLRKQFGARFGMEQLVFDEHVAFWLSPSDPSALVLAKAGTLDRLRAIASATSFEGRHFDSLASQFDVSVDTMALRLRELGLVYE
ncbi:MAG: ImmA/IrrE family metallo-endopeptidase [bacterium]